ncbi:helix-turn-helix domain-containing protein [Streptomyces noursei]|uniref:helix-turn-helix domain-containing protein n=1 Tax=Streptomyces noursei TaxID=1971 RepID=UPI00331BADAF
MTKGYAWPEPRKPVKGQQQKVVAKVLLAKYDAGASIRALAAESGRSYGYVHRTLTEAGAVLRTNGGKRRTAR